MKQCKECGTLSPDDTVFCYICGTKFPKFLETAQKLQLADARKKLLLVLMAIITKKNEVKTAEQKLDNTSVLEEPVDDIGAGKLLFNGVYQYKHPEYSSYLRFFADGKVVEVGSTGTPRQIAQWLNHEYESYGFYTVENDVVRFTITHSSGRVSYSGKILKEAIDIDLTSHINGYSASDLRYYFIKLEEKK